MPSPSSAVPTLLSQQIDRCLSLLQKPSSSDEDKFASLLLLPRLFASAGDEVEMAALVARVYEGMNVKFLTRMLRTTTTAATTARSHSSKASSLSSMLDAPMLHSVALEILDCFCTSFDRDLITGSSSSFSSSLPDLHRLVPCIPAMIQISLLSTSLSSSSSSSSSPPPHCNDPSEGKEDEGDLLSLNRELVLHCLDVMARCCESAQAVLLRPDILLSLVGHMLGSKEEEQEEEEEQGRGTTGNLLLNLFTCTQSLPTLESLDHIMTLLAQSFISKQTPLTFSILHLCIAVLSRAANFKDISNQSPPKWADLLRRGLKSMFASKLSIDKRDLALTLTSILVRKFGSSFMLTLVDRNTTTTTTTTINTTLTESKFSLILVHIVCAETRVLLDEAFESSKPITIEVEDHPVSSILPPSSQVASSASASAAHDDVDISKLSLSERIVEVTEEEEKLIKEAAVQAAATSTSSSPSSLSEEQVIEGDSSDDTQAPLNIPSNAFTKNESRWKHMLPVCLELVDAIVSFLTELDPTTLFEDKSTSPSSRESLSKSLLNIQNILTETFKALTLFIDDRYSTYKLHLTTYTVKPLQGNGTNEMSGVTVNVMGDEAEGYSRYLDEPCFILALRSFSTWFAEESLMDENGAEDTGHSNNFSGTGGSKRDARFMPGVEDGHDSFGESAARIKALIEICCLVCQKGISSIDLSPIGFLTPFFNSISSSSLHLPIFISSGGFDIIVSALSHTTSTTVTSKPSCADDLHSIPLVAAMVEILINILVVDQTSGRRLDGQKWKLVVDRLLFICEADSDNLTMTALATFVMYIVTIMERSVSDRTMVSFKTIDDRREWEAKCLVCVGDFIIMGIRCEGEDDQDAWSEIEELWILCFDALMRCFKKSDFKERHETDLKRCVMLYKASVSANLIGQVSALEKLL